MCIFESWCCLYTKKKKSLRKLLWLTLWNWSRQCNRSLPVVPSNQDAINFIAVISVWKAKALVTLLHTKIDNTWVEKMQWVVGFASERFWAEWKLGLVCYQWVTQLFFFLVSAHFFPGTSADRGLEWTVSNDCQVELFVMFFPCPKTPPWIVTTQLLFLWG